MLLFLEEMVKRVGEARVLNLGTEWVVWVQTISTVGSQSVHPFRSSCTHAWGRAGEQGELENGNVRQSSSKARPASTWAAGGEGGAKQKTS